MFSNPLIAKRHPRLGVWIRAFLDAGYRPTVVAYLFRMDMNVLRQLAKETR